MKYLKRMKIHGFKKFVTFVIIGIVVSIPIYFINYTKIKKYKI